jgi:hypothetical protein
MASTIKVPVPRAKQEPCQETPMSGKVPMPMAVKSGMPRQPRSLNHAGGERHATWASNLVASVTTYDQTVPECGRLIVSDDEHWGPWAPIVGADATADSGPMDTDPEDNLQSWPGSVDPTPLQDTRTPCLSHSRRLTPYIESRFGCAQSLLFEAELMFTISM